MAELHHKRSVDVAVLDATGKLGELVASCDESSEFRSMAATLNTITPLNAPPIGLWNEFRPRVLGDLRMLRMWEIGGAMPATTSAPIKLYLRALAEACLPILAIEAMAGHFRNVYFPTILVSEKLNDPLAFDVPNGLEFFAALNQYGPTLAVPLPRCVIPFLPVQLRSSNLRYAWASYRDALPRVYSRGIELTSAIDQLSVDLARTQVLVRAKDIDRRVRADREAVRLLKSARDGFKANWQLQTASGSFTLESLRKSEAEVVRQTYVESPSSLVRDYFDAVRCVESLVNLIKSFVAEATLYWPFVDLTPHARGPFSIIPSSDGYKLDISVIGIQPERYISVGDYIRIDGSPFLPVGYGLVRESQFQFDAGSDGFFEHYIVEWIGRLEV